MLCLRKRQSSWFARRAFNTASRNALSALFDMPPANCLVRCPRRLRDRWRHGCRHRAPTDGVTACPASGEDIAHSTNADWNDRDGAKCEEQKNWLIADSCGCLEALDAASSIGNKPFPAPPEGGASCTELVEAVVCMKTGRRLSPLFFLHWLRCPVHAQGVFGAPKARIVTLRRRKKRPCAPTAVIGVAAATTSACVAPVTCAWPAGRCTWSSSAGGSIARGAAACT